ncbi:flavodoxin domain-containing protein [Conexibacter sp. SYSU D00693]|uniref:flavodoxin domain-containing protein n=1 Tax=Conexibacter sp. SYSU D00693 TaxID=2812560 RepID=UPI00196B2E1D|nr:flavodoxin domain-containing protein [Conexibacter sp. SYSU D00693]
MSRALVVFASKHGHTRDVATRVAQALERQGVEAHLADVEHETVPDPSTYEGYVVAASVHAGQHQRAMTQWVRRHHTLLSSRPSTFLSVSLTAADDTDDSRDTTRRLIEDFLIDTGWKPDEHHAVAGALQWREYDVATRVLMRLIARHHGAPTDVHDDVVYTDWVALDQVGTELAGRMARVPAG